ncbi:hypothetical protein QF042_003592 [Pedobacter sp. W3I1]|nr:hypothetical protein [Pedobacter sp. W3I1]
MINYISLIYEFYVLLTAKDAEGKGVCVLTRERKGKH